LPEPGLQYIKIANRSLLHDIEIIIRGKGEGRQKYESYLHPDSQENKPKSYSLVAYVFFVYWLDKFVEDGSYADELEDEALI